MFNLIRRENRDVSRPRSQESWDPFRDPFRMMDALMRWEPFAEWGGRRTETFVPHFDVKESKDGYLIRADLPGVKEKDLDISLSGNVLTVSGHREEERKEEKEHYYAMERTYGQFTRSFTLPEGVDGDKIQAGLKEGVLTLELQKKPEVQAKKIPVSTTPAVGAKA